MRFCLFVFVCTALTASVAWGSASYVADGRLESGTAGANCDTAATATWTLDADDSGVVESVTVSNIAAACRPGRVFLSTNLGNGDPYPFALSAGAGNASALVNLSQSAVGITTLNVLILSP